MQWSAPKVFDDPSYQNVLATYRVDEAEQVARLLDIAALDDAAAREVEAQAAKLVEVVRAKATEGSGIDAFMQEYELSSAEGVVLMCLAEALLRIPDSETIDKLIEDKVGGSNWESHLGESKSWFVNASTWGLMISGRMLRREDLPERNFGSMMRRMVRRSGEPFIRSAVRRAMRVMGHQFVMGRSIEEALKNARALEKRGYSYSYDMLGEAARTDADAQRYFDDYHRAIEACGEASRERGPEDAPGVSVKLSALHARYELGHRRRVLDELLPRLQKLTRLAARHDINLTVDAEEADRLDLSLELFELASADDELGDWQGFGLAIQAYQKRALDVIEWLADLGRRHNRRIMVRLVKGAYWDTEIKRAQEAGLAGYPVFTRKANTDVSFMACARRILAHDDVFYGQFATHNAHTLAYIRHLVGTRSDFEFQRLHGMGEELYSEIVEKGDAATRPRCRIYAPVGAHEDLLAYLVRRLLENGANSSFVNRLVDENEPIADIVADPVRVVREASQVRHPRIPLPHDLYGERRPNARGIDLSDLRELAALSESMTAADAETWQAGPLIGGKRPKRAADALAAGEAHAVPNPAHVERIVGHVAMADDDDVEAALAATHAAAPRWAATPAIQRAACLRRYADLLEAHMGELIARCTREAGKNIADGVAEVREAVDFCRYYAVQVEDEFAADAVLPGPTGERNTYGLYGRGVFVAICPWNFPLAIFTGQVAAALAAGNAVIAKPAEQSCLIGARAVELMHEAGFPGDVLAFLPGAGEIGAKLVADPRIAGVAFTGSLATARKINQTLAERDGPIIPLIAETGGQNAMIVDSSALIEQVVADIIRSGFQSAGQRCSALRLLYVQSDIADTLIEMLTGAMAELAVGDPWHLGTDVTPVIDAEARDNLAAYAEYADKTLKRLYTCELDAAHQQGTYIAPRIYELESIEALGDEQFGPIVHIIRFDAAEIDDVVDRINGLGYGLTFGIHSRIDTTVERVLKRLKVGNAYVNRNIIGAVVGVHPFGGEGLSGTGPKAGGPNYLHRFATERAVSRDTTAAGGNASLMSLEEDEPAEHVFVTPEPQRFNRSAGAEPARNREAAE
ncbi:bifunctional proline dehydrogenase/L-glutamate gamma-semialdehyde dehydrogenase PutA [Salinisphaera sp.]|uniref:bifunctional proline dehydrogenase/L-glutamate gamma-semialdehyde dehydrogenase PutA n=1 Tax=Salinisphaera sp. TaxID=1914330 RepID=UPI002D771C21|nr:bifunctional proline dehydrogenase/L-glutamate gamma-semialdehyde dehydrogenase PutA [Salinisphaera sp.]HET7312790.1 bifunctional proline dehydrogenase/L-glutamate gamma-semialdehyde dehydrogenase PutA [Salinisphaera sp.]